MADRIDHGHDGQTERQSDAEEADPEVGKARRDHRAAAAAENQPEGADELGQSLLHIAHMTLSSRRRSWAPPARSDVISRSAYDNPSSHTASGGCDGLDEMARPLLEREGGVGQPRRHPEIGRASCWERVCPYVCISVFPDPIKKKKKIKH